MTDLVERLKAAEDARFEAAIAILRRFERDSQEPEYGEEWNKETVRENAVSQIIAALQPSPAPVGEALQPRVLPWMLACFGPVIPYDKQERGDRLLEEVFELLQSGGYDPARVLALRDYVWGRDVGEPFQEVGGVMITLAAYCIAHGLDMHEAGETELARIWTKVEAIRAKQAAKPTGSALPIAVKPAPVGEWREAVAALKPFADRWAATFGGPDADQCSDNDLFDSLDPSDFRRAAEALAKAEQIAGLRGGGGDMARRDFASRLKIMRSLDLPDLIEAGVFDAAGHGWSQFRADPATWLLTADDSAADKAWALVEERASR